MSPDTRLEVLVERAFYPVAGSTAGDLRTAIQTLGPIRQGRVFDAFTDWKVTWNYSIVVAAGDGVRISDVRAHVRALLVLPRWRSPSSASRELVGAWQRYVAAVEAHEQGHVNLAVEAGCTVVTRLESLPAFTDVAALKEAADSAANDEVARVRERERLYDDLSSHGATQGAVLSL